MRNIESEVAALMGALVADAASLGLHWIYDVERISEIVQQNNGRASFVPLDIKNFEGVSSYFAHGQRSDGMFTQYGETLLLTIRSMLKRGGRLDVGGYQKDYLNFFGPGGNYNGYIDAPTRGTLLNIQNGQTEPSGIDDDQLPAVTRIPAIVVANQNSAEIDDLIEQSIQITNVNSDASNYGRVFSNLLTRVLRGEKLLDAMELASAAAGGQAKNILLDALQASETGPVAYGEITGRACHLPMGMPLAFHILKNTSTYEDAIETNIKAGGDSAGRGIIIGAVAGGLYGISEKPGIPLDWILRTDNVREILKDCKDIHRLCHGKTA